ncbi:MAG: hypothetical protein JO162_11810 [Alphaproteobacteria bacterium]|nr:hypothetical protein [Alphaproteobacteria bacterium]
MRDNGAIAAPPFAAPEEPASCWDLLQRLDSTRIGQRAADGAIVVRRRAPAGCFLYGPYLHLKQGAYRLTFRSRSGAPHLQAQPVLGIEICVLNRFLLGWRDFTAAELAAGGGSLDFAVPPEHSLEAGPDSRFEFRFVHLHNADLAITTVELVALAAVPASLASRRRMLGRLEASPRGKRISDGSVSARRFAPSGLLLYGGWPYLRLPQGAYRLVLHARCSGARDPGKPALLAEVIGYSRWRRHGRLPMLAPRFGVSGVRMAVREASAAEIASGPVAIEFAVPSELAVEAGSDAPFEIRVSDFGNGMLTIDAVDLLEVKDTPVIVATPQLGPAGRPRVVIVGNCQSEKLRQGFVQLSSLNRKFEVKYHFVELPEQLHEFAARDLETCDVLLIQDIQLWDRFPLRDRVRTGAEIIKFPLVRFASLWPFDGWNGPGDSEAMRRDGPDLAFPYLDGLLARLRKEIPDREQRFQTYRSLEIPGLVNYRRLHQLEERRLLAMDKKFGIDIGAYVLDHFQTRRVFHSTVRANRDVLDLLMRFVLRSIGVAGRHPLPKNIEPMMSSMQVPVHPRIAHDLGVRWAHEGARYTVRGRQVTWEAYIRSYIEHYG